MSCNGTSGNLSNIIIPGQTTKVGLRTNGGEWIASVSDQSGITWDVATIKTSSPQIFDSSIAFEEGYPTGIQDPFTLGRFVFYYPEYRISYDSYASWPVSISANYLDNSFIYSTNLQGLNTFCPQNYGANVNIFPDSPRVWFEGSGGMICEYLLFPGYRQFIPSVKK